MLIALHYPLMTRGGNSLTRKGLMTVFSRSGIHGSRIQRISRKRSVWKLIYLSGKKGALFLLACRY